MLKLTKKTLINQYKSLRCITKSDKEDLVLIEDSTIHNSDLEEIANPDDVVKVIIPAHVFCVEDGAFDKFVNLQEATIEGEVWGVYRDINSNGAAQRYYVWDKPTELAKALKEPKDLNIRREFDWG